MTVTQRKIYTDFLERKSRVEDFGEHDFGLLAFGLGLYLGMAQGADPERQEAYARTYGYSTMDELVEAYKSAIDHYQPKVDGKPINTEQFFPSLSL